MNKVFLCVLVSLVTLDDSHAYLDPGTGSFVLQAVIGGVLGAIFTIKTYWAQIKAFFSKNKDESDKK